MIECSLREFLERECRNQEQLNYNIELILNMLIMLDMVYIRRRSDLFDLTVIKDENESIALKTDGILSKIKTNEFPNKIFSTQFDIYCIKVMLKGVKISETSTVPFESEQVARDLLIFFSNNVEYSSNNIADKLYYPYLIKTKEYITCNPKFLQPKIKPELYTFYVDMEKKVYCYYQSTRNNDIVRIDMEPIKVNLEEPYEDSRFLDESFKKKVIDDMFNFVTTEYEKLSRSKRYEKWLNGIINGKHNFGKDNLHLVKNRYNSMEYTIDYGIYIESLLKKSVKNISHVPDDMKNIKKWSELIYKLEKYKEIQIKVATYLKRICSCFLKYKQVTESKTGRCGPLSEGGIYYLLEIYRYTGPIKLFSFTDDHAVIVLNCKKDIEGKIKLDELPEDSIIVDLWLRSYYPPSKAKTIWANHILDEYNKSDLECQQDKRYDFNIGEFCSDIFLDVCRKRDYDLLKYLISDSIFKDIFDIDRNNQEEVNPRKLFELFFNKEKFSLINTGFPQNKLKTSPPPEQKKNIAPQQE